MSTNQTRIVLNAIGIKTGGGLRKTLTLLQEIAVDTDAGWAFHVICVEGQDVHRFCIRAHIAVTTVKPGVLHRLLFESGFRPALPVSDAVLNIGGTAMLSPPRCPSVTEFAYSNILFPEIDFWQYEPPFKRLVRRVIDHYRRTMARRCDILVVQTPLMKKRAELHLRMPPDRIELIKPAISGSFLDNKTTGRTNEAPDCPVILFACGDQRHKRLHLLPELAAELSKRGIDVRFRITLSTESMMAQWLMDNTRDRNTARYFEFVGQAVGDALATQIVMCDAIANIALLESFSNNFVEAWAFEKPLITVDSEWAESSAGDAAFYINPENPSEAAAAIGELFRTSENRARLVENGRERLRSTFQTSAQKYQAYKRALGKVALVQ